MRKAFISGNIGRDATSKPMPNGDLLIEFSLANNDEAHKLPDGSYENVTSWFNVKWFAKNGDKWLARLHKGAQVSIECDIKQETWEKDGQKHSKIVFYIARGTYPIIASAPISSPAPASTPAPAPSPATPQGGPEWMY